MNQTSGTASSNGTFEPDECGTARFLFNPTDQGKHASPTDQEKKREEFAQVRGDTQPRDYKWD